MIYLVLGRILELSEHVLGDLYFLMGHTELALGQLLWVAEFKHVVVYLYRFRQILSMLGLRACVEIVFASFKHFNELTQFIVGTRCLLILLIGIFEQFEVRLHLLQFFLVLLGSIAV